MSGPLLQMTVKLYVVWKSSVKGYVVLVSLPPLKFVHENYETGCLLYQVSWKTEMVKNFKGEVYRNNAKCLVTGGNFIDEQQWVFYSVFK
jgi:hypothetical protein